MIRDETLMVDKDRQIVLGPYAPDDITAAVCAIHRAATDDADEVELLRMLKLAPWPPLKPPLPKPKPPRVLDPCGTPGAYQRHRRAGEPIDEACGKAHRSKCRAWRADHLEEARISDRRRKREARAKGKATT